MYPEYNLDLEFCRGVHREYGKSFYFGTLLMGAEYRDAICVLYAFFRLPDEYIDTTYKDQKDLALEKLNEWKEVWGKCYRGEEYFAEGDELKVLRATKYVFDTYKISFEYSEDFISAMIQDTSKTEYQNYKELEDYMYGSAVVVGYMMVYIVCSKDKRFVTDLDYRNKILDHAKALGEAFQMTNFLRDIYEDVIQRDRVYLPQDEMQKFGVTKDDLVNKNINQNFIDLMKFEIARTEDLYKKADIGLQMLPKREAKAIKVARVLYSKIIVKIEVVKYDIFAGRVHLSFGEKLKLAFLTLIKKS
ncbi:MAG: phytoene/squalene synthase family protein [Candidatus Paceibacterota bacterium]